MRDALLGDRPALVRLFVENGLDVGQFLTWKQLEYLYAGAPEVSLLHQLLERRHGVGPEPSPPPEYLLVERSLPDCHLPQAPDAVAGALAAARMLRELSHLEPEAEEEAAMKDLAMRFENLAIGVFGECYRNGEPRAYKLLVRRSQLWGGATVLQLAHEADARLFFAHDGVQSLLTQNWWGEMDRSTPVWQLLLTFFCPPLIFTNLITFRTMDDDLRLDPSGPTELDSLDTDVKSTIGDMLSE
ncbi:hypothetical protein JD844_001799 [Phrynosoma platyrhinos]|uniref:TRPM-like domain-containing protein n=1 Tax=Phrynosoma platyrhinos TaxID=52577 RepID=A0ABQ7TAX9_PHRPL|nr:hypothetical protein JD844_001799 [Phrynosoma platyrhinos]